MFYQIFIGSLLIILTIAVEVTFIEIAIAALRKAGRHFTHEARTFKLIGFLTATTLWLLAALSIGIWIWAIAFVLLGAFETLESALYFSMVAFTTLGLGDLTLPKEWRLLSGMIAANGLVLFGLNTAFLIDVMARLRAFGPRPKL